MRTALLAFAALFAFLTVAWALLIAGWIVALHVERWRMHRRGEATR